MSEAMAVLEKTQVEAPKTLELPQNIQEEIAIREQSKARLGFHSSLSKEVQGWAERKKGVQLSQILSDLGIPIYSPKSVEEYKKSMQDPENRRYATKRIRFWVITILVGALCAIGTGFFLFINHHAATVDNAVIIDAVVACIFMGLIGSIFCGSMMPFSKQKTWRCSYLSSYSQQIPPQALALALTVQEKLSKVNFRVEYFAADNWEIPNDPFLTVSAGDREYHIAVWDEKGFRG